MPVRRASEGWRRALQGLSLLLPASGCGLWLELDEGLPGVDAAEVGPLADAADAPDGAPDAAVDPCRPVGLRVAACVGLICPATTAILEEVASLETARCAVDLAAGDLSRDEALRFASQSCQSEPVARRRRSLLEPSTGPLGPLCNEGPAVPLEVCEEACRRTAGCPTSEGPQHEGCLFVCLTRVAARDAFICRAREDAGEAACACPAPT